MKNKAIAIQSTNLVIGMNNMPNADEVTTVINHKTKTLKFTYLGEENEFSFSEYEEWLPIKLGNNEVHCEIYLDEILRLILYPYMKRISPIPEMPYEIDCREGMELKFTEIGCID